MINNSSKSITLFESTIKSEYTRKNYRRTLDQFLKFVKLSEYNALLTLKENALNLMLEDYLLHLGKTISPSLITPKLAGDAFY